MKRTFFFLSMFALLGFVVVPVCDAVTYNTINLTTDSTYNNALRPDMNDNGHVVWKWYDGSDIEIFLYDGTNTIQITDNSYNDGDLQGLKGDPQINTYGRVVWIGDDGSDTEIFLYDGSDITQITDNAYDDEWPQINDDGHVVWYGYDGSDYEIFLYDGTSTNQLTHNTYDDKSPQINGNGDVVWYGYDGSDYEIFLYEGTGIVQITNNSPFYDVYPKINGTGLVVWYGQEGSGDCEIFLYDGTSTIQITDNTHDDFMPQINENGHVVWSGDKNGTVSGKEIYLYDGMSTTQITHNYYEDDEVQINNNGYLVWSGQADVFLAEPIGGMATAVSKELQTTIPGSRCFAIDIENLSSFDFTVAPSIIWTESGPSDVTFTGEPVSVAAGQTKTVTIPCFEVGSDAVPGAYDFDILWTGSDSMGNPVEITTDPTLHLVSGGGSIGVGGTAQIANKFQLLFPWMVPTAVLLLLAGAIFIQRLKRRSQ